MDRLTKTEGNQHPRANDTASAPTRSTPSIEASQEIWLIRPIERACRDSRAVDRLTSLRYVLLLYAPPSSAYSAVRAATMAKQRRPAHKPTKSPDPGSAVRPARAAEDAPRGPLEPGNSRCLNRSSSAEAACDLFRSGRPVRARARSAAAARLRGGGEPARVGAAPVP